jgi:hypothetical protein
MLKTLIIVTALLIGELTLGIFIGRLIATPDEFDEEE